MRLNQVESNAPEMLCHTLNSALGTAARGEKCALANAAPSPEFCMPTSSARDGRFWQVGAEAVAGFREVAAERQVCLTEGVR